MKNGARTKEDFDKWFLDNNGDPWGYESKNIKNRIQNTFKELVNRVPASFDGGLIEFGAFNGSFTYLLAQHYSKAQIVCNDISEVAILKAKAKLEPFNNIDFVVCDFLSIDKHIAYLLHSQKIILLLECLYYLNDDERKQVIDKVYSMNPQYVFLSAPIWGGKYFTEDALNDLLNTKDYCIVHSKVLNIRPFNHIILKAFCKIFSKAILFSVSHNHSVRRVFGGQTLFVVERIKHDYTN